MKKILLVHLPFCTPASPPYSIAHIYAWARKSCNAEVIDLNLEYHRKKFPEYQKYFRSSEWKDYDSVSRKYKKETSKEYSENHKKVVKGEKPEFLDLFVSMINSRKPDIVAFSIIYSSQAFYAYALAPLINAEVVAGGPSANEKIKCRILGSEAQLAEYLGVDADLCCPPDFSCFELSEYFAPSPVIPLKTSESCSYRKCSFCTHYSNEKYSEFPVSVVKKAVKESGARHFFLIDEMIPPKRLAELSEAFKGNSWTCQLKPLPEFDLPLFKKLRESGLKMIMWGVESGNDRILSLMNKGTSSKCIEKVLKDSHDAGIKNIVYMMFGFPTETREEFKETIDFLSRNSECIDLVSNSVFGLQKGTEIFSNPSKFGISKITETPRTVLEPRIEYEVSSGLSQKDAEKLRGSHKKTLEKLNKFPKVMNFFREHMLLSI